MSIKMRLVSRSAIALCLAFFAIAGVASATTFHVHPGQSIQAAINQAHPGDTVVVEPGTYDQSLQISTNRITLRGNHAVLVPPTKAPNTVCNQMGAPTITGICVIGQVSFTPNGPPTVTKNVAGVTISGITVRGFSSDGIFGFGTERMTIAGTKLLGNGGYGVFSNTSTGTSYLRNLSQGNGDAGFYIGDSPKARATVWGNRSFDNAGEGLLARDASYGTVRHNVFEGNCAGVLVLADAPGPATYWLLRGNVANRNNNGACHGDPSSGEPPVSGVGIALIGAGHTQVIENVVNLNRRMHDTFASGGILVIRGFGGTAPSDDLVARNSAFDNKPFDVFWDGSGSVTFTSNHCGTSSPSGLCS